MLYLSFEAFQVSPDLNDVWIGDQGTLDHDGIKWNLVVTLALEIGVRFTFSTSRSSGLLYFKLRAGRYCLKLALHVRCRA